ncbi:dihydrofolate reductase [Clostridia bacterium]|nr:dihydrofolate reductase [Clostridia bacterium]
MKIIAAVDALTRGIGFKGELLCRIPEDMAMFRRLTMGKTVVMGHNTLKSLPNSAPLSGRNNIVLSRDRNLSIPAATVIHNFDDAPRGDDVFVIGGQSIYELFLDFCDTAYITNVRFPQKTNADAFFPKLDENWLLMEISETRYFGEISYEFQRFERRN